MSTTQRYKRDNYDRDDKQERHRDDRRRRSRSRSRYQRKRSDDSHSRSRSRSLERRRRRGHRDSYSRSRSRSHSRRERRHSARRNKEESRSPNKTQSRSRSRSQERRKKDATQPRKHNESSSESTDMQLRNVPLPKRDAAGAYANLGTEEPIDKERIHREIEEKLRQTLAKEGKVYPPPKAEASHPVFANDGSFLEIFKKMQQAQNPMAAATVHAPVMLPTVPAVAAVASTSTAAYVVANATGRSAPPPPLVGRRRGGKILKTGVVAKPKAQTDSQADPKDFWALYLAEVNKYKNNACESDGGTRPLVK